MLVELEVRGFRNLTPFVSQLGSGTHLIVGDNGAGKTSLLEAIYLLATTRSFRTSQLSDCCRHGASEFHLRGTIDGERHADLELDWFEGRRVRSVNGKRASLAEHLEVLPTVLWTASDVEVLTGAPAERRRLLDRGVVGLQPSAISILSRYRQALAEKRQLLAKGMGELGPWNHVLAATAAELIQRRAAYALRLEKALRDVLEESQLGLPRVEVRYRPSPRGGRDGIEAIEKELEAHREKERRRQLPLVGPHRDDLEILWDGHELRRVASAGERKALGLAMLAAHARVLVEVGRPPIYLLDDIDTELDRQRLEVLWRVFFPALQLFATSNRPQVWEGIEIGSRWACKAGSLEQLV